VNSQNVKICKAADRSSGRQARIIVHLKIGQFVTKSVFQIIVLHMICLGGDLLKKDGTRQTELDYYRSLKCPLQQKASFAFIVIDEIEI
jgi:hypothetical protein